MPGWSHLLSGMDIAAGAFAMILVGAAVALAALGVAAVAIFQRVGYDTAGAALWAGAIVVLSALLAALLLGRSVSGDLQADRRAIESRAAALTAQAVAPGSPLACLDSVESAVIETACEKSLFATPEAVAAAVAYTGARFDLFVAGVPVAERDPAFRPLLERMRRAIEADRFGLVAHVLMTRGCTPADCGDLKLMRDPSRVLANMNAHTFEARVGTHALGWAPGGSGPGPVASSGTSPGTPTSTPETNTGAASNGASTTAPGTPGAAKYDFPSADSIPPVSIMAPEPPPPPAQPKPAPAKKHPAHPKTTRPPAPPPPPRSIAPTLTTPQPNSAPASGTP